MSEDTDADDESTDDVEPAVEPVDDGSESDRPDLDEDSKASFDIGQVDDIADDIDDLEGDDQDVDDQDDQDGRGGQKERAGEETSQRSTSDLSLSWGDLYVDTLATLLVVVVDEYGDGATITEQEIIDLAQSGMVDISEAVDQLVVDMGGPTELPPEYAVVLGTALLAVAVLGKETDLLADALGGEA